MLKKVKKMMLSITLVIAMLPIAFVKMQAETNSVFVTTWKELHDALEDETIKNVNVEKNVVIEQSYDALKDKEKDFSIDIKGEKNLYLLGKIVFSNSVNENTGLICLWNETDKLNIYGTGTLEYKLNHYAEGLSLYLEEGNIFYLSGGSVTVFGDVDLIVSGAYVKTNHEFKQCVFYGPRGTVTLNSGTIRSNTELIDGYDMVVNDGLFNAGGQQYEADILLKGGSLTINGGAYTYGISHLGGVLSTDENLIYMTKNGKVYHNEIPLRTKGVADVLRLIDQTPSFDQNADVTYLDPITYGESKRFSFEAYKYRYMFADWNYTFKKSLMVKDHNGKLWVNLYDATSFDVRTLAAGSYEIIESVSVSYKGSIVAEKQHTYYLDIQNKKLSQVNVEVDYELNQKPANALSDTYGVNIAKTKWQKRNGSTYVDLSSNDVILENQSYAITVQLGFDSSYGLGDDAQVYINGYLARKVNSNEYMIEISAQNIQHHLELYEIQRPVPGCTPDFKAHVDSANTKSATIHWYELNEEDEVVSELATSDTFKQNTRYQLVVEANAATGYEYLLDYASINRDDVTFEYDQNHQVVYASVIYDTSKCIQEIEIADIEYPIPGHTPDYDVLYQDDRFNIVAQVNGSELDWYYETNPGTSGAGFVPLEGKFKGENRRHQVLIELEANDGYYFALNQYDQPIVEGIIAQGEIDWSYQNDTLQDDGMCTSITVARTFDLAQNQNSVFIGGIELKDGCYLDEETSTIQLEQPENGYAYYHNHRLILNDFHGAFYRQQDAILSYDALIIETIGQNSLRSKTYGISAYSDITFEGEGLLNVYSNVAGIFAFGNVTMNSGMLLASADSGIWMMNQNDEFVTMNGGMLVLIGANYGLEADDDCLFQFNAGSFFIVGGTASLSFVEISNEIEKVFVAEDINSVFGEGGILVWDEQTPLNQYPVIGVFSLTLKATQENYKTVKVSWDKTNYIYEVYRKSPTSDEFKLVSTQRENVYYDTVTTGKEYQYKVVMKDLESSVLPFEQIGSNIAKCTTQLEGKPKLMMKQVSTSKFKLSWNAIDGATRYIIYRKRNDDKMKKVLTLGSKDLEYTTAELPHGDYQFILKAGRYDSKDRVMTGSSNTVSGSVEMSKPAITLTTGSKQIKVSWKKLEGVTNYEVYRATSKTGKYTKLKTTTSTSYTTKNLTKGKEYFFKVCGYKTYKSGDTISYKVYTDYSSIKSAKAK